MKPLLIALSVFANAVLVFAVVQRSPHWQNFLHYGPAGSASKVPGAATAEKKPRAATAKTIPGDTWKNLTQGDLKAIAARLKAEGFPASLQRAIITALVMQQFADRHHALAEMINAQPWWTLAGFTGKVLAARQKLQRDEKDAVDAILGPDAGSSPLDLAREAHQYGNLSPEKLTALAQINSDYNDLINEIRSKAQGILLPEDREQIAYLQQQQRADVEKLLTPDEMFEYDLRTSPSAGWLRNQLTAFSPTEDEFRALFKIQQAYDAQYANGNFELMTPEQRIARNQGERQLLTQAQAVLAPDRFAELKQKTDPSYMQAAAIANRLQLPASAAADIVAVQKDIMTRATAVRRDQTLTPAQRVSQLNALGSEAVLRLTPTLGPDGVTAYRQSSGGWINQLQRQPAPAAPAPAPAPAPKP
ncbi:MAG TPA: hypothetical protein VHE61_19145 [Opitutaceae bacterium]|nr:hypothetical protein [Opitutaceae bacterium]